MMADDTSRDPGRAEDKDADGTAASDHSGADAAGAPPVGSPTGDDGESTTASGIEDLFSVEDADVETSLSDADLSVLEEAEQDLIGEMRTDMLRAQAELVNFRMRVERDRAANREAVIAEVMRSLLPALDDLTRAETHGDLEGSPLAMVGQKIRSAFEKYGLKQVGTKGEPFDPNFHEALVQLPSPDVTVNTVADVIEPGYVLGERLIRAAKVAVHSPSE